jgi:protoporphyrinogen/coproporphyrinogen III oxidase
MIDPPPAAATAAPRQVVVVGAGISGLAAAWEFAEREPTAVVTVLEAAPAPGGKLRLAEVAGVTVDVGAEALLARRPEGVALINALGLGGDLITPLTLSAQVRGGGANHPLPARTMMGIPGDLVALGASGVLSPPALARVLAEPQIEPMPPLTDDVAVGPLVRERLGDEVVSRLVDPLLGGVYAGRADALSLAATMPALAAALRDGAGSLVAAAAVATAPSPSAAGLGPVFVSLAGGLGRLPLALAANDRFRVLTGVTVRAVRRTESGFELDCGPITEPKVIAADAVIIATPAAKAAGLLRGVAAGAAAELAAIETASMAIVTLAFDDATLPPGSGLLVGSAEPFAVKAITISSQKWPVAPPGLTLLRASIGRAGEVSDLQHDDVELVGLVRRDLAALIGVTAAPVDSVVTRWGGGLPQYAVGHVDRVARIETALASVGGLAVCGASYQGLGIPACIASAARAVARILGPRAGAR